MLYYSSRSHGAVVCTCTAKGHCKDYCKHVTSPNGKENGRSIPDDCERTVTVELPTAASPGLSSYNHISTAALDAFSTVFELPLGRSRRTHTHTHKNPDTNDHTTSLCYAHVK